MTFPLLPVVVTAGLGTLGYALFKPDAPTAPNNGAGTLGESSKSQLPPVKRPADLPPPAPAPLPIPIPSNAQPAPLPPIPIPLPPNVQPAPNPIPQPPLPLPVPTPVTPTTQTGVVVAPSGVNLRKEPSTTTGAVLVGLTVGTRVKINTYNPAPTKDAPKGWYNVTAPNGMTGWATAEFILPDNGTNPVPVPLPIPVPNALPNVIPVTPVAPSAVELTGVVGGSPGANMRAAPNEKAPLIKGLFNGTTVTVLSPVLAPPTPASSKGWVSVKDSTGATGWMSRNYVTPLGGSSFGSEYGADDQTSLRRRRKRDQISA